MSINMDTADDVTDYSSFEYEQFEMSHVNDSAGNDERSVIAFDFDVLQEQGGLDQNEVAELVYLELDVGMEFEDSEADQDVATSHEFRGVVGSDLSAEVDQIGVSSGDANMNDNALVGAGASFAEGRVVSRPEIFQPFRIIGSPPFDDEANGLGGNAFGNSNQYIKNFRQLTGRGPVLDSSDSVSAVTTLITSDTVIPNAGILRGHLVYDVATVDEAGARFSIPSDD